MTLFDDIFEVSMIMAALHAVSELGVIECRKLKGWHRYFSLCIPPLM
jgi:hypothetical protein